MDRFGFTEVFIKAKGQKHTELGAPSSGLFLRLLKLGKNLTDHYCKLEEKTRREKSQESFLKNKQYSIKP